MDIKETKTGVLFRVKAQPNAGKNAVTCEHNGMLKVKIACAPERGRANEELIGYLSGLLNVSKSRVQVVKGMASREKTVVISGMTKADFLRLIQPATG